MKVAHIGSYKNGVTFIQCMNIPKGSKSKVEVQGQKYYTRFAKDLFESLPDTSIIEVFDDKTRKKFLKSFVKFIEEI